MMQENKLLQLSDDIVITTHVEKRLRKQAQHQVPKSLPFWIGEFIDRWIIPFFWISSYFVVSTISDVIFPHRIHFVSDDWSSFFWISMFIWCSIFPYIGMIAIERLMKKPRNVRETKVKNKILDLAKERKLKQDESEKFYRSPEWLKLREMVIENDGHICAMCRQRILKKQDITVDHIKPRSKYPELALDRNNLRILCRRCNSRKGDREYE